MPSYRIFDPERVLPEDRGLVRALERLDRNEPVTLREFTLFTVALHLGFKRLCYATEVRPTDGAYFWVTDDHARQIGRALRPLDQFHLTLTTFERRGLELMAAELAPGVAIREITIGHKSGDEVTEDEAAGLAALATRAGARTVHLWAGEYAPGALDALAGRLESLGNASLVEADVCDTSRPEPEDRIRHPGLEALIARNRARR